MELIREKDEGVIGKEKEGEERELTERVHSGELSVWLRSFRRDLNLVKSVEEFKTNNRWLVEDGRRVCSGA